MRHAWIAIALTASLSAACTDGGPESAADRMRGAYALTQQVDVGGFSLDVQLALEDHVLYAAGYNKLVRIDRATGQVRDLIVADTNFALREIASDATAVYAVWQPISGTERVVRIPVAGGEPQTLLERTGLIIGNLEVHGDVVYVLGTEVRGTGPDSTWHEVLLAVPATGGDVTVLTESTTNSISAFTITDDGVFVGRVLSDGWVTRTPLAGGAPIQIQASPGRYARTLQADATGVYWSLGTVLPATDAPTPLFHLAPGATTPVELAAPDDLALFALNHLGFYWISADGIRAIASEDLAGAPVTLLTIEDATIGLVADDRGLAYATSDDLGDLEVHLIPLHE